MEIPEKFKKYLGVFGILQRDASCGEPISWGYPINGPRMGQELWDELKEYVTSHGGKLAVIGPPRLHCDWGLITKSLTHQEAIIQYGFLTKEERGPNGGYRANTYGSTRFGSKLKQQV